MAFSGNIPKIKNPVRIYLQDFQCLLAEREGYEPTPQYP